MTNGFILLEAGILLTEPALVGVTDLEMGVDGFSSIFLVDGVLAFDEVPLLGLHTKKKT